MGQHVIDAETGREEILHVAPVKRAIKFATSTTLSWTWISFTIWSALQAQVFKEETTYSATELVGTCCTIKSADPHDENSCCGCWKANDGCGSIPNCYVGNATDEADCIAAASTYAPGATWIALSTYSKYKYVAASALLNLFIIVVYGIIYEALAQALTNWENHRTQTQWNDSRILKNFMFQFINNYFVLFYICYFRPFVADCRNRNQGTHPAFLLLLLASYIRTNAGRHACV